LNKTEIGRKVRSLFSYCAYHFLEDGFSDSIYLLLPFIAVELKLSFSQVGLLRGVSLSTGLLQFPLSLLGEKIGELTVIVAGIFGLACGFLIMSRVYTFTGVFLSLIFAKGTAAGQHSLGSSILSRVFEASGRRAAMGTYNFSGDMGKVCLPFLVAVMISLWDWRKAVFILSVGSLVVVGILWGLFGERKEVPQLPQPEEELVPEGIGLGIRNRRSFSALLAIGVIDISTREALLTFLPFLLLEKGVPMTQVGFALTLLFAGGAVGKFVCGLLAERLGIIPMVVGTEVLTAAGILSLTFSSSSAMWIIFPLIGIVLNGTSSVLYATVAEIISPKARSRGYGLYYSVTLGIGAVSPIFYGFFTEFFGLLFTIMATALMVLLTLPLSRYLPNVDRD
jgi:FSR family fosmidomycin resistance protein-like MFS transporter